MAQSEDGKDRKSAHKEALKVAIKSGQKTESAPAAKPAGNAAPTGKSAAAPKKNMQHHRRIWLLLSFITFSILPVVVGGVYYTTIATDRYTAGASFVVRGLSASSGGSDIISSFTGITSSGSTTSDSYILRSYLKSSDIVRDLDQTLDLRAAFSQENIDLLSRFDPDLPFEYLVEYWQRRIIISYDSTSGIITFEVQAFTPEYTLTLANAVLERVSLLINTLSENARKDSVQFAAREVELAEERLLNAQVNLRTFRSQQGTINPVTNAELDAVMISLLKTQLVELQARVEVLAVTLDEDAPTLLRLRRQAKALANQIQQRRDAISSTSQNGSQATADLLAAFEELQINQTFAQQRYASALSSLEAARMDADRQQRYLAIFSHPMMPQQAQYPYRIRNILLIAFACFAFWGIGVLVTYAVRDHLR